MTGFGINGPTTCKDKIELNSVIKEQSVISLPYVITYVINNIIICKNHRAVVFTFSVLNFCVTRVSLCS